MVVDAWEQGYTDTVCLVMTTDHTFERPRQSDQSEDWEITSQPYAASDCIVTAQQTCLSS